MMALLLLSLACAPAYDDVDVKLVGVGYDPEEIGPAPTPYGGVVEYSWIDFAGAGLSLALMGLGSFDEVGPAMVGYEPPYAAVYGFSYIFSAQLPAADSLGGVTSVPPEVDDTCYTTFDASGPIGSFDTVDVGSWMRFSNADGTAGLTLDRLPGEYPANQQDSFVYYSGIDAWTTEPVYAMVAGDANKPEKMERVVVRPATFPFGEQVSYGFPGGFAPPDAPVASMPMPSLTAGDTVLALPGHPGGVQVEWEGPRYDAWGHTVASSGLQRTCLAYAEGPDGFSPDSATACDGYLDQLEGTPVGQMYTGPWDTADGDVTLRWMPGGGDDFVHIAIRFLGPVDREQSYFLEEAVVVPPDEDAEDAWKAAVRGGAIPADAQMPDGRRPPMACEQDGTWIFDDAYLDADGELVPALRGDPFHNLAEVTCRLKDDGEFAVTEAMLSEALAYARSHGAEGAVFYFGRSVETDAVVPPVMDTYGQRRDVSPVKVASRAIQIGRFWYGE